MDAAGREFVRSRAEHRCEYCRISQLAAPFFSFHVEHIRARQHRGSDDLENLALACPDCNAFKGLNLSAVDPQTDELVVLFNPRQHEWDSHFEIHGAQILGRSQIGRATVELLNMNDEPRMEMRQELLARGEF